MSLRLFAQEAKWYENIPTIIVYITLFLFLILLIPQSMTVEVLKYLFLVLFIAIPCGLIYLLVKICIFLYKKIKTLLENTRK